MAIRVGHASIDENGKASGGTAGDQTGREVKISNWYNGSWDFVARAKEPAAAEAIAAAAEAGCNNPNIGYDQSGRNTLMTQARSVNFDLAKITTPCEADCSSFVSVCVRAALGKDFYTGNAPTTATLKKVLSATGAFEILTDSRYLTNADYLHRGDILDNPGKHAVIVLDDGKAGESVSITLPVLQRGCTGASVKALQILLIGFGYSCGARGVDGDFGSATEAALKAYQKSKGLTDDGSAGRETWSTLLGIN